MSRITWQGWLLVAGIAALVLACFVYRSRSREVVPILSRSGDAILDKFSDVEPEYVGWSVCSECHKHRVTEFLQTRHFHALLGPEQLDSLQGFQAARSKYSHQTSQIHFEMTAVPRPTIKSVNATSGQPIETSSPVEFVYGAGAGTDEVYFTRRGDQVFEMPVVWLTKRGEWGASNFNPSATGDVSRPLSPQCLECHTVWVDYKRGTLNEYGRFNPQLLGVTCERCHGPAKEHVNHHRAHPDDRIARNIVQPKSLSRDRLMDVCAQCHTNSVRYRRAPYSFRPGEVLEDSFRPMEMQYPEEDRVANQVRYLKESRCYQQSESLTCITCHNPHVRTERADPLASSRSCLNCHVAESCGAQGRIPEPVQGQCAACHMPRRRKVQVNFETEDGGIDFPAPRFEHRIAVYPEAEQELILDWLKTQMDEDSSRRRALIAQSISDYWTRVGDSAQDQQRFIVAIDAYQTASHAVDSEENRQRLATVMKQYRQSQKLWFDGEALKNDRHLEEAIDVFKSLVKIEPNLAKAHFELGTLYAATGRSEQAIEQLELATKLDVNDPSPHAMLGWLAYLNDKPDAALVHYRQAQEIDPWNAKLEFQMSQCFVKLRNWDDALQSLERALTINPNHPEASHSTRQILRERFSAAAALPRATQLVQLTRSGQPELLLALAEIYCDLGRIPEGQQALSDARKAVDQDQTSWEYQFNKLEKALKSNPTKFNN